jgi:hypothetical protein
MSATNFKDLEAHIGHNIVCVGYGKDGKKPYQNVAVECEDCNEVLLDYDRDQEVEPLEAIMIEFIGESNSWEWYSIVRGITEQEAIKNYLTEMGLEEEDEIKEEFDKRLSRDGSVFYAKDHDVRAYKITIN